METYTVSDSSCASPSQPPSDILEEYPQVTDLKFNRLPRISPGLIAACDTLNRSCLGYAFPQTDLIPSGDLLGDSSLATASVYIPSPLKDDAISGLFESFRCTIYVAGNPTAVMSIQSGILVTEQGAQVALTVDDYLTRPLFHVEIDSLDISDVADLVAKAIRAASPNLPRDIFAIERLKVGISPFGAAFNSLNFGQGTSVEMEVLLFGKRVGVSCTVEVTKVAFHASVDNFALGPLMVKGTLTPEAVVECEIGPWVQHMLIDCGFSVAEAESTIRVLADVLPSPRLDIFARSKVSDVFQAQLQTGFSGSLSLNKICDTDFVYDYRFNQSILKRFNESIEQMMKNVGEGETPPTSVGIEETEEQEDVIEISESLLRKGKFKATPEDQYLSDDDEGTHHYLSATTSQLPDEPESSQQGRQRRAPLPPQMNSSNRHQQILEVLAKSNEVIGAYVEGIDYLQEGVKKAQRAFDQAMYTAQSSVEAAQAHRESSVRKAKLALNEAKADMIDSINSAQRRVADAKKGLSIFTSSNYVAKLAAYKAATVALEGVKASGKVAVVAAYKALSAADLATKAGLDAAKATLEATRLGVQFVVLRGAKGALRFFKTLNQNAFRAAIKAVVCVAQAIPWLMDAFRVVLRVAQGLYRGVLLFVGKALVYALRLFDLQLLHISGSVRGIFGLGGEFSKPLRLCMEGMLLFQPFHIHFGPSGPDHDQ